MAIGRYLLLLPLLMGLAGCHTQPQKQTAHASKARVVNHATLADSLREIDRLPLHVVSGGYRGPFNEAIETLVQSRVVLVGETHTHYEDHLVQLAVLRAVHQRQPAVTLGVEWFQQDVQEHLDDYIAGRIDEAEMLDRTEYYERWRFDYRHYRPIMEYARSHGLPVLALNAPAKLTRRIGREGIQSLTKDERRRLPATLDRSNPTYVDRIRQAFDAHGNSAQPFDNFLSVQLVWDETMARNSAAYLERNPDRKLVLFAGTGHAGFQSAIPDRLIRRLPVSTVTVVTLNEPPKAAPIAGSADVVVVGPALELPPSGKLGVLIQTEQDRVVISKVLEESGAHRSGIRAGDQIVTLEGRTIKTFSDLKLALLNRRPGDEVDVAIRMEDGPAREIKVILQ